MRFGTVSAVNEDSTVDVSFGSEPEKSLATLYGYQPIIFEQVIVAEVDGEQVILGSVYNRASDLEEK